MTEAAPPPLRLSAVGSPFYSAPQTVAVVKRRGPSAEVRSPTGFLSPRRPMARIEDTRRTNLQQRDQTCGSLNGATQWTVPRHPRCTQPAPSDGADWGDLANHSTRVGCAWDLRGFSSIRAVTGGTDMEYTSIDEDASGTSAESPVHWPSTRPFSTMAAPPHDLSRRSRRRCMTVPRPTASPHRRFRRRLYR